MGSHLTAARGLSRPGYLSKCPHMKLAGYSLSSQRSQSLACLWRNNPLWLRCSFNLYLSLPVRLLINVVSHTALSHCLPVNSTRLDTLTAHVAFQNGPSEIQEPEVSRAHAIQLQTAPAATCADSRARGSGGGRLAEHPK